MVGDMKFVKEYINSYGDLARACLAALIYLQNTAQDNGIGFIEFGFPPKSFGTLDKFQNSRAMSRQLNKMRRKFNCSVHQQMLNLAAPDELQRRANVELLLEGFKYAMLHGLNEPDSVHVLHLAGSPGRQPNTPVAAEKSLREIVITLKKMGFLGQIGLENMTPGDGVFTNPVSTQHLIGGQIKRVIDTGHDSACGHDPVRHILELGYSVCEIHLVDTAGSANHCVLGAGVVDIPGVLAAIRTIEREYGREIRVIVEVGGHDFKPSWGYLKKIKCV